MIKLVLGGSPCTHWSIAQTKNRETEPSGMGWELFKNYLIGLEKYNPTYFLYENNKSMAPAIREQITKELGVEPILINSALVSAQNRQRLYWTNIPGIMQPVDRGILLRDVLESGVVWNEKSYCLTTRCQGAIPENTIARHQHQMVAEPVRVCNINGGGQGNRIYSADGKSCAIKAQSGGLGGHGQGLYAEPISVLNINPSGHGMNGAVMHVNGKSRTLTTNKGEGPKIIEPVRIGTIESEAKNTDFDSQQYRVYSPDGKSVTLCGNGGGVGAKTGLYAVPCAARQTGRRVGADGKTYPIYEVRNGLITIKDKQYPIKLADGYYIIRKLTVTECKRLQTVPDSYIFPVSDSQAYKMLGNGWTVDVIAHILSHAPGITTEPVEVLSMYDGMSCGHIALDKLGANVVRYYATEIDKYAIQTTMANYPATVHLGDAFQVRDEGWRANHEAD